MESKRQYQQEGDERDVQALLHDSKRRREDSQQSHTLSTIIGWRWLGLRKDDIVRYVGDIVRRVVREELADKLDALRPTVNHIGTSGTEFFELVFQNELPDTVYTFSEIKAKDKTHVKIALWDPRSQSIVADGQLSSIKIEICVFVDSADKFNDTILQPRASKGKLLKGETTITLKNGVGYITNLEITDNTCWLRTRCITLGAKVVPSKLNEGIKIRSGRSKPFVVKDKRGQPNQKLYPLSLSDEVRHLKKMPKTGKIYLRLSSAGINTIQDLLQELQTNPTSLREKFGKIATNTNRWEAIIKDAETCTFDGQSYPQKNLNYAERDLVPSVETIRLHPVNTITQATPYGALDGDMQHFGFPQKDFNWSTCTVGSVPQETYNIDAGNTTCFTLSADMDLY